MNKHIKHYTELRDEITLAKEGIKRKKKFKIPGFGSLIGGIISLTIVVIVGANVLIPVIKSVNTSSFSNAETNSVNTVGLIAVVGIVFVMLSVFGINDGGK